MINAILLLILAYAYKFEVDHNYYLNTSNNFLNNINNNEMK